MDGFVVCEVLEQEAVPGKDKLWSLVVGVGGGARLAVVTNAGNVEVGKRVVVAPAGCTLRDGTEVAKTTVGGCKSEGVLCDAPMLGWQGGGSGAAALVPDTFSPGDAPPARRPRMDGKGGDDEGAAAAPPTAGEMLFERKLTKEEKKAAAEAKRAARKAKKEGGPDDA